MNYKELYNQILEKTDNFKQTNGIIKLSSKNDLDIAFNILSQMYKNVKKVGLDYSNKEQGSLDYKISYNNYKDIDNNTEDVAEQLISKYIGESLEKATPYMLRNDGKLIKCELKYGNYHPYILSVYDIDSDIKSLVLDRFSELEWFYNNTNNKNVKEYISIIYHSLTGDNYFNDSDYIVKDDELKQFAIALNNEVNNEFCRVRTSNVKYGGDNNDIYFRISSIGFNWFPLIWDIVANNKEISNITISRDNDARNYNQGDCYKINGKEINHMPRDEFLTLKGNPIIEKYKFNQSIMNKALVNLDKGLSLTESLLNVHPRYINNYYNNIVKNQLKNEMNIKLGEKYKMSSFNGAAREIFSNGIRRAETSEDVKKQIIEIISYNKTLGQSLMRILNDVNDGLSFEEKRKKIADILTESMHTSDIGNSSSQSEPNKLLEYKTISKKQAFNIIDNRKPIGKFIQDDTSDSGFYVAIDNSTGDAWTEEFTTLEDAIKWLDNDDIDEAIEKHDTLNPNIWDENNELLPEVREKLEEIVKRFKDNLKNDGVELDVIDTCIIGSNASYNYNPTSDIDLHIIADTSVYKDEDLALKAYQAYKALFNNKYDPMIRDSEVEIYVEPYKVHANSKGIYSFKDGWIKEPEQTEIPEIDQQTVEDYLAPFKEKFDDVIKSGTLEDVNKLIDDIYLERQSSIIKDGEFAIPNLAFKEFRAQGYLQKLRERKVELENAAMSLDDNVNSNIESMFIDSDLDLADDDTIVEEKYKVHDQFKSPHGDRLIIEGILDNAVKYSYVSKDRQRYSTVDPKSSFDLMLESFEFKKINEEAEAKGNGFIFRFPEIEDTLHVFLQWEGIYGYDDDILDYQDTTSDDLASFLEDEGIYGYTYSIWDILKGEKAFCSGMDISDFEDICNESGLDPATAEMFDGETITESKSVKESWDSPVDYANYSIQNPNIDIVKVLKKDGKDEKFIRSVLDHIDDFIDDEDDDYYDDFDESCKKDLNESHKDKQDLFNESYFNQSEASIKNQIIKELEKNFRIRPVDVRKQGDNYLIVLFTKEDKNEVFNKLDLLSPIYNSDGELERPFKVVNIDINAMRNSGIPKYLRVVRDYDLYKLQKEHNDFSINSLDDIEENLNESYTRLSKKFDNIDDAREFEKSLDDSLEPRIEQYDTEEDGSVKTWYEVSYWDSNKLDEKIVKKDGKYQVQSEKGKNMGTYDTKKEAEERLKDVEMFKHMNEAIDDNDDRGVKLANYLEISNDEIDYVGNNEYTTPVGDYFVVNSDEAYKLASEYIIDSYNDMGLSAFTPSFRSWIIDNCVDEEKIDKFIDDEIEYFTSQEPDEEMVDYLNNLTDKQQYVIDTLGGESEFVDWLNTGSGDSLDKQKMADKAISEDGIAHFIAFYDGEEIDLGNDLYAYRVN